MTGPLPSLQRLGDEFERLAQDEVTAGVRRGRSWRAPLLAAAAVLCLSAVALATGGILPGAPVTDQPGTPPARPHVGEGVVRPETVTLTVLRTPDPAGGPPWGLRTFATTRAQGCVQVGRVVDDRLGILGQDGAFGNDGRFHELSPAVQFGRDCALLDAAGQLFIAMSYQGLPASAQRSGCVVRQAVRGALPKSQTATVPLCPARDMRILYYGTLGPDAKSVTYTDRGRARTVATRGPWGAYLVVMRPSRARPAKGYFSPATSPGSGLTSITYRDGHQCRLRNPRAIGGARECPRVGYVSPAVTAPTAAQLHATVTARVARTPTHPPGAPRSLPAVRTVTVDFTAPVAAGPRSSYFVTQTLAHGSHCSMARSTLLASVARDVRAGERVTVRLTIPADCRGGVLGYVRLEAASGKQTPAATPANPFHAPVVGRYSAPIPRG